MSSGAEHKEQADWCRWTTTRPRLATFSGVRLGSGAWTSLAVAAWLGDTVKMVYETYAHLMPNSDDRGRSAMNAFFMEEPSAPDVPSQGRK